MKFCSACAHPLTRLVPEGDTHPRDVCTQCGMIHYQNPRIIVGTLPVWIEHGEPQVLLCRRAIEPRLGYWTLPAGFMEIGETTEAGAARETWEEAGAKIDIHELFAVVDIPHVEQVYMLFRASLVDLDFAPGPETLEARMFRENDIPWGELAFQTMEYTLRAFFDDHRRIVRDASKHYRLHTTSISSSQSRFIP